MVDILVAVMLAFIIILSLPFIGMCSMFAALWIISLLPQGKELSKEDWKRGFY